MNAFFQQALQDFRRIWDGLTQMQKVFAASAVALAVAVVIGLVAWSANPAYAPLFTNVSAQDAGAIVDKLKEQRVPYRIEGDGGTIMVPADHVRELRLQMASQGLPQGGYQGFELFDKGNGFGMTDAMQKLNFQRALQGELARTISSMDGVDSVRVHLNMPEEQLFADDAKEPTAAVELKLKPGYKFSPEQARTVTHLVAKSVEGLKEANVFVTDEAGHNYTDDAGLADSAAGVDLSERQIAIKKDIEKGIRNQVQAMLDRTLGANQAIVNVAADVNFDQEETNQDLFLPVVGANGATLSTGILRSSHQASESYDGNRPGGAEGIPGTPTNVPSYQGEASGRSGHYQKTDNLQNYEISEKKDRIIKQPAQVRRLSVSAALNGDFTAAQIEQYRQMIAAAAGVDAARQDTVVVTAMKFNDAAAKTQQATEQSAARNALMLNVGKVLAAILIGLLALWVLRRGLQGNGEPEFDEVPLTLLDDEDRPRYSLEKPREDERKSLITAEISKMVRQQPDEVARLVRSWMSEED